MLHTWRHACRVHMPNVYVKTHRVGRWSCARVGCCGWNSMHLFVPALHTNSMHLFPYPPASSLLSVPSAQPCPLSPQPSRAPSPLPPLHLTWSSPRPRSSTGVAPSPARRRSSFLAMTWGGAAGQCRGGEGGHEGVQVCLKGGVDGCLGLGGRKHGHAGLRLGGVGWYLRCGTPAGAADTCCLARGLLV